jgi:hypothetical protein
MSELAYPLTSLGFMAGQAAGYNVVCWMGTRYMAGREKLELSWLAKAHNIALSAFSGLLAGYLLVIAARDGRFESHDALHCHPTLSPEYEHIIYLFYLSKLWEMLDTVLLIAAKKPVIWLHKIHHSSTLSIVGAHYYGTVPFEIVGVFDNLLVHTFMYAYFAFPSGLRSVRWIMTVGQIAQFLHVLGYACLHALMWVTSPGMTSPCDDTGPVLLYEMFWYLVYLVLFVNFFRKQYLGSRLKQQ